VSHELKIAYFDTRGNAEQNDLDDYDEIFTSGFAIKNDGGGGHYKRYNDLTSAPALGFTSRDQIVWGLIPDGGVVNPFQGGAEGDGTNDQTFLQLAFCRMVGDPVAPDTRDRAAPNGEWRFHHLHLIRPAIGDPPWDQSDHVRPRHDLWHDQKAQRRQGFCAATAAIGKIGSRLADALFIGPHPS
jgi:hypothetical protein